MAKSNSSDIFISYIVFIQRGNRFLHIFGQVSWYQAQGLGPSLSDNGESVGDPIICDSYQCNQLRLGKPRGTLYTGTGAVLGLVLSLGNLPSYSLERAFKPKNSIGVSNSVLAELA